MVAILSSMRRTTTVHSNVARRFDERVKQRLMYPWEKTNSRKDMIPPPPLQVISHDICNILILYLNLPLCFNSPLQVMLHVPDLPEADAVQILRYFLSQAAISAKTAQDPPVVMVVTSEGPQKESRPPLGKRARGESATTRASLTEPVATASASDATSGARGVGVVIAGVTKSSKKNGNMKIAGKKRKGNSSEGEESEMVKAAEGLSSHNGANGTTTAIVSNGNVGGAQPHDDGGTSGESDGVSDGDPTEAGVGAGGAGGKQGSGNKKKRTRDGARWAVTPAERAERGVRVALTLPHNEAFLRSALSGLNHGEVIVVLKASTVLNARVCFKSAVWPAGDDGINAAMSARKAYVVCGV